MLVIVAATSSWGTAEGVTEGAGAVYTAGETSGILGRDTEKRAQIECSGVMVEYI